MNLQVVEINGRGDHYITKGKDGFRPWQEVVAENNAKPKTVVLRQNGKIISKKVGY